jgi:hypothetical protein
VIKINLALKKQGAVTQSSSVGSGGNKMLAGRLRLLTVDEVRELPLRRLGIPLAAAFLASQSVDYVKTSRLEELRIEREKVNQDVNAMQVKLKKLSYVDDLKKQVETDFRQVELKLGVIHKLILERKGLAELMAGVADSTPRDIWLSALSVDAENALFSGSSTGFIHLTEFIKNLTASGFFSSVDLTSSAQGKGKEVDKLGSDVISFELRALRKRN